MTFLFINTGDGCLTPLLTMPVSPCPLVFVRVHLKRTRVHSENVPLGPHTRVWNFILITNTLSTSTNALGNLTTPLFFLPGFIPGHSSSKYIPRHCPCKLPKHFACFKCFKNFTVGNTPTFSFSLSAPHWVPKYVTR